MNCQQCGAENAAGQRFCDECGHALASTCPSCGRPNRPGAHFCGHCGTTLDPPRAYSRFGGAAAEGGAERRLVSVLFADLVGFTPFAEERDAEHVRETLSRYFDAARDVIERHGGTVEKFIGDAVMAVWGTPVSREDDAERAVRAALELLPAVSALGDGLNARAAVLTGEAAVSMGATTEALLAGDLVNTAARLQAAAAPGTVLVGEGTMRASSGAIAFEPAGEQVLKGKSVPIAAWRAMRLVGTSAGRTRASVLEPPFVGRQAELELLKEAVHAAGRDGRSRLVALIGPAGVGKSRLAWELEKYLDGLDDIQWVRGRSPSYGEGITFWALGEMVRRQAGLAEGDDEPETRGHIGRMVADLIADEGDRGWVETALLTLLGVEPPPAGGPEALFAAWRTFFEAVARQGTTVLVFEDLHWADSGLLDFIDHLLDWSPRTPIVVLGLTRPDLLERRPDFGRGNRHFQSVPLQPLSAEEMEALLAGLAPDLPPAARRVIVERADGIPLYAVETIRMLIADGRLRADDGGGLRLAGELAEFSVPESLRSLIEARLDALDPADRALLQHASVLGHTFSAASLAAVGDHDEPELEGRLRSLVRRDLLSLQVDARSPERGQYGFVQGVVREVAYGTLSRRERRRLHLAAARQSEATGDEETAGAVATHYLAAYRASDPGEEAAALSAQARVALRAAADRAMALGANAQALGHLQRALEVTTDSGDRGELLERAASAAAADGRPDEAVELARSAGDAFREAGDDLAASRTSALLATIFMDGYRMTEAEALITSELEGVPQAALELRAALYSRLARVQMRTQRPGEAVVSADRALEIGERLNLIDVVADALVNKGAALSDSGRRREGVALLRMGTEVAAQAGAVGVQIRALTNIAATVSDDDPRDAMRTIADAIALSRRVGMQPNWLLGIQAVFAFWAGDDWDAPLTLLDEAAAATRSAGQRIEVVAPAVQIRLFRGEAGEEDVARIRQDAALTDDPHKMQGWALSLQADAALVSGDLATAHDGYLLAHDVSPLNSTALEHAVRAAFWMGDPARARRVLRRIDELPFTGRVTTGLRIWARAGIAALEGDTETGARELLWSIADRTSVEMHLAAALFALDALHLVPQDPAILAEAASARDVFERVRARPLLERLDAVLDDTQDLTATPTSPSERPTPRPAEASPG